MKLIRFGQIGFESPGVYLDSGLRKDCSAYFEDWNNAFFQNNGLEKLDKLISEKGDNLPEVGEDERWGACVARPGKVICIGLNYKDHAEESGMAVPDEPIIFQKAANTVIGPFDTVLIPRQGKKTDWEVELGIIIGKDTRYLEHVEQAADAIAGYCISNDVSERAFQLEHGGQWTKGKSCDNFNPLGPYLVTKNEIPDVNNLAMTLEVNGQRMQTGNTKTMVFDPLFLVHYLSRFMTLEAGDLISTGTPPGVGMGMNPPQYLKAGDTMSLTIENLGEQQQICKDA